MSTEFWQLLLGAEMPHEKSRALVRGLGSSLMEPLDAVRHHASLTPNERQRLEATSLNALSAALREGVQLLMEDTYPEPLQQAENWAPPALFVQGNLEALNEPTVGIVGTRNASAYGKACAHKFAESLAAKGVTIVSGGALGIDAAAHRGALAAGGATVAVLAGGIDNVYPSMHAALFRQMRQRGCLISQYAVGSRPNPYKFLARNGTIAALSQVLILVEAPTKSGALTTANASIELGREVFVVPANIDNYDFRGSFNLIRDGATLVYHPEQVLEVLGISGEPLALPDVGEKAERILRILGMEPIDAERIVERTGLSASDVLSELTMLELEGRVRRDSGGYLLGK